MRPRLALRWLAPVAVLAAFAATYAALPVIRSLSATDDVPVVTVERGRFRHEIEAEGLLVAEQATVLSTPSDAGFRPVNVGWLAADGSAVEAGDVVIRFDPTEMEKELLDGQADRLKAESNRRKKEAEEDTAIDNLELEVELADLQVDHAQRFSSADEEIFSRAEIIESQLDVALATERRESTGALRSIREGLGRVELELLDLEAERADITIDRARAGLASLEIRAPHSGIFVLRRDYGEPPSVGAIVYPGQPLAEIPRLAEMKAQVFVLEADAGGLRPGLPARVVLEAHPTVSHAAEVRKVATVAKRRSRYSPVQYFEVELALGRTDPETMKPGQRVRGVLVLQDLEDVLTVPREAVFRDETGRDIVHRAVDGGFEPVEVELGETALGHVVVTAGLAEGDVVALADPAASQRAGAGLAPAGSPASPGGPPGGSPGGGR
jgi:multidrug efflux pump subunit AcrA (membrane-fusion protein)